MARSSPPTETKSAGRDRGRAGDPVARQYIPALRFRFLTRFFDTLLPLVVPEHRFRAALVERAGIAPGADVLDLGCGTGTLLLSARVRAPTAVLYGIDLDDDVLRIAVRKSRSLGAELRLCRGAIDRLPFAGSSFDRIVSTLVFHHLTREVKRAALREALRVLRPGGELHVADWGKPANAPMRAAFLAVQALDGFRTTRDNVAGFMPLFMQEAGFGPVIETGSINTAVGTLRLHRASKPS